MKRLPVQGRTLALIAVLVPLVALLAWVALRSGPLAPVSITVATVQAESVTPSLFGVGTVQARYRYRIGPVFSGRLARLDVQVGDRVRRGQTLGEMDPVDLDARVASQDATIKRVQAAIRVAQARHAHAQSQARRYEQLFAARSTSEESVAIRQQELRIAEAALDSVREELVRARSDRDALLAQRRNLRLLSPVNGLVALRAADPGTTVVAGQAVVELIDPASLWIDTRLDQSSATGLAAGLPARIVLRSRSGETFAGRVLRVEPIADAVTEETLAKVVFDKPPGTLPPIGELAEVTVSLPALPAAPVIPNAAIRRESGEVGVWKLGDGELAFTPVKLGASDLDGRVQVRGNVEQGDQVVLYSESALGARSRIRVVERIEGVAK
ncbi:MAG: efflux RND transporter periplasmic adaptor subunit [Burkholderiaceae bacterium]|nr:efflux RND transporter periplasmic adaptor subunit [Burkholderiaceae bacterium]